MKIKNIALTISSIGFAIGFSDAGESTFWYMGRPIGAIFFIVFFIFMLLEKEYAILDEQNRATELERQEFDAVKAAPERISHKEDCAPALTEAPSH
jgi:hypothetical protein